MNSLFEPGNEAVRHERAMASLCDRTGAPLAEVRSLFTQEFFRLEPGARVRPYLAVLTASNVRNVASERGVVPGRTAVHDANQIEAAHRGVETSADQAARRCDAQTNHETSQGTLAITSDRSSPREDNRADNLSGGSHA